MLEMRLHSQPPLEEQAVTNEVDELNARAWELRRTDTKEALVLGAEALRTAAAAGYLRGRAYSLLVLGYGALRASDLHTALERLQAAREYFDETNDREGRRRALNTLGIVYGQSGNYVGALETFLTLQHLCAELGEAKAVAEALNNTGAAYFHLGDYASALECHLQALEAFRTLLDVEGEIQALTNIGMVYFERGRFDDALGAFRQAQHTGDTQDGYTRALLLNHLGRTYLGLGQPEEALLYNRESLALMDALGDPLGASYTQDDLAAVYLRLGQLGESEACLLESLRVKRTAGDTKGEAEVCLQLGQLYLRKGLPEPALDTLHESLSSAQQSSAKVEVHKAHLALAEAYEKSRQFRESCLHLKEYVQLSGELFNQDSDLRLQGLRIRYEVEQTEREREIYRLRNVELAQAVAALRELTASLQNANDEKAALVERLEQQSREDGLTGLYNRRYIDTRLEGEFARARRYGHPLSVVLCDVDHFKRVNDTFSHQMGDEVLRRVAQLLRTGVRQSDTVARYGGEEFIVLFPEAAAADAARIFGRIRKAIADYSWEELQSGMKVTVSAGVADDLRVASYERLVGLADKKLYDAKRNGRNQVCF